MQFGSDNQKGRRQMSYADELKLQMEELNYRKKNEKDRGRTVAGGYGDDYPRQPEPTRSNANANATPTPKGKPSAWS